MNYYEILGVGPDATEQQIKEAYRREAMKWHPDRHEGAAAKGEATRRFKDLAEAYRTLRNAVERANYDRFLEQRLHQEYEARQQEQTRQQRAQSEQARWDEARQKQAHANQAGSDSQDTKPGYEEDTTSSKEANQMFFEQMLDLATELAGRGFPEFNILKALIALGCPEALAKTVAATASKKSQQQSSRSAGSAKTDPDAGNANPGPTREDYYKAAIGPKNQEFFLRRFKQFDQAGTAGFSWPGAGQFIANVFWLFYRKMTLSAWLYIGLPFVLLLLIYLIFGSDVKEDSIPISFYNIITAVACWLFLPARMNAMYYRRVNKLILDARSKSNERAVQLAFLNKHGNTSPIVGWLLFIPIAVSILAAMALPAYQDYTRRAQVATGFNVGTQAAKQIGDYYAIKKTAPTDLGDAGFVLTPSTTVADVAFDSQTGMLTITFKDSFFSAKSLLLVPSVTDGQVAWFCTSEGITGTHLPAACKVTQEFANARLASMKSESQANNQAKADYARALAIIEVTYPELNPDSPRYNAKSLEWVAARKAFHQERGQTPINALQLATANYAAKLLEQSIHVPTPRPYQTQQSPRTGGISQSEASRTICQTWPDACR